jgi:hypothetical protein
MHDQIREHMDIIGADGVHVGTVDKVEGDRIKLTKKDSGGAGFGGGHDQHHHYIPVGLVASVDDKVRLSANGAVAVTFEEEAGGEDIAEESEAAVSQATTIEPGLARSEVGSDGRGGMVDEPSR